LFFTKKRLFLLFSFYKIGQPLAFSTKTPRILTAVLPKTEKAKKHLEKPRKIWHSLFAKPIFRAKRHRSLFRKIVYLNREKKRRRKQ